MRLLPFEPEGVNSENCDTTVVDHRYHRGLLFITLCLMGIGLVMVYSASIATAAWKEGNPTYFLTRQLLFVGMGLFLILVTSQIHYAYLLKFYKWIFIFSLCLLIIPIGLSVTHKGASRWIPLGPIHIQPSECAKIAWIIFLSALLTQKPQLLTTAKCWVRVGLYLAMLSGLLLLQKDFGSLVICTFCMLVLMWVAGAPLKPLLVVIPILIVCAVIFVLIEPYRITRIKTFLNPELDTQNAGYQVTQAKYAFGNGGWLGVGLGGSRQKLAYLPEAHTDFIFSIIGEELGLIGVALVVFLFICLILIGLSIARKATSGFGTLLAFGFTFQIAFQALFNMGVNTSLLPNKGLTLPFISYGGSSMLMLSCAVGLLLNISRRQPPPPAYHCGPDPQQLPEPSQNRRRLSVEIKS